MLNPILNPILFGARIQLLSPAQESSESFRTDDRVLFFLFSGHPGHFDFQANSSADRKL